MNKNVRAWPQNNRCYDGILSINWLWGCWMQLKCGEKMMLKMAFPSCVTTGLRFISKSTSLAARQSLSPANHNMFWGAKHFVINRCFTSEKQSHTCPLRSAMHLTGITLSLNDWAAGNVWRQSAGTPSSWCCSLQGPKPLFCLSLSPQSAECPAAGKIINFTFTNNEHLCLCQLLHCYLCRTSQNLYLLCTVRIRFFLNAKLVILC